MLTEEDINLLSEIAKNAAITAGKYIQSQFDQQYEKLQKDGGESVASQVVTDVDYKAQEIILQQLKPCIEKYNLGLLTEEAADDSSRLDKSYFWCIDPMDGTLAFTKGQTGYSVSIALVSQAGSPLIGIVYIPDLEHCYTAKKGKGLLLNDQPFERSKEEDKTLHIYLDQSMKSNPHYSSIQNHLNELANQENNSTEFHFGSGAVCNAIGVLNAPNACYFKFPKKGKGGGSIWDYAATRLFFEELGLIVSNSIGNPLHLNSSHTTFMNRSGVIYATNRTLLDLIFSLACQIEEQ